MSSKEVKEMNRNDPIRETFLKHLNEQLGSVFTIASRSTNSVKLQAKTSFALGLLVGCIMQHYIRDGTSFDRMVINVAEMSVQLHVKTVAALNKLELEWA